MVDVVMFMLASLHRRRDAEDCMGDAHRLVLLTTLPTLKPEDTKTGTGGSCVATSYHAAAPGHHGCMEGGTASPSTPSPPPDAASAQVRPARPPPLHGATLARRDVHRSDGPRRVRRSRHEVG